MPVQPAKKTSSALELSWKSHGATWRPSWTSRKQEDEEHHHYMTLRGLGYVACHAEDHLLKEWYTALHKGRRQTSLTVTCFMIIHILMSTQPLPHCMKAMHHC